MEIIDSFKFGYTEEGWVVARVGYKSIKVSFK